MKIETFLRKLAKKQPKPKIRMLLEDFGDEDEEMTGYISIAAGEYFIILEHVRQRAGLMFQEEDVKRIYDAETGKSLWSSVNFTIFPKG